MNPLARYLAVPSDAPVGPGVVPFAPRVVERSLLVVAPGLEVRRVPRDARWEKAAGVASFDAAVTRPTRLPPSADFSVRGTEPDAAFFLLGTDLVRATAAQVVRDMREELGLINGAVAYTADLIERAEGRARELNGELREADRVEIPGRPTGTTVPIAWLQILVWVTYAASSVRAAAVRFPRAVRLPTFDAPYAAADGLVMATLDFNPATLSDNPFDTVGLDGDPTVVGGGGGGGGGSYGDSKGNTGVVLALVALGAAALASGGAR